MRIPSGKVDQAIFFIARDSSDLVTRKTGLTTFTVYRSRNGGTATIYTTPTVAELSAANMPGVYSLLIDEDTAIASTSDSEEYCVHITQASMAPVTRTIELYRHLSAAAVNAEVVDALATDTYAEPAQGAPGATASLATKIGFLFKAWRNKSTQDATTYKLFNDDAATVDHKATTSDDGAIFTRGEVATGP